MANPLDLLRKLDDPSHFAALMPRLEVERDGPPPREPPRKDDLSERPWLATEGLVTLGCAIDEEDCGRLTSAIDACLRDSLPATFLYVFDETWELGERIRARVDDLLAHPYLLLADAWAWRIDPGRRGWPPHRGRSTPLFERTAPELLNVWIALTDATADRSCMHFVPLDDDPHYPAALGRTDAPLERARAVPVARGTAVMWNANVLHWGGPCSPRAVGPRMSCSFTLCRADALATIGFRAVEPRALDFRARIELIAEQIVTYGDGQPDVSGAVREWARIVTALASRKER